MSSRLDECRHDSVGLHLMSGVEQNDARSQDALTTTLFYVFGFGKFGAVLQNPTESITRILSMMSEEHSAVHACLQHGIIIGAAETLETSSVAVIKAMQASVASCKQRLRLLDGSESSEQYRVCFLHLGVDVSLDGFSVERFAVNEACFRFPDERGWQPMEPVPVVETEPLGKVRQIRGLDADWLCAKMMQLQKEHGWPKVPIRVSENAGRFLCNYIYYVSLYEGDSSGDARWQSIFLHCPSSAVVSIDDQVKYVLGLMQAVAEANDSASRAHAMRS